MTDMEMLIRARELLLSMAKANVPSQDDERQAHALADQIMERVNAYVQEMTSSE